MDGKVKHFHGGCAGPRMQTTRILGSLIGVSQIENFTSINEELFQLLRTTYAHQNLGISITSRIRQVILLHLIKQVRC
jgi:hypothetical protein